MPQLTLTRLAVNSVEMELKDDTGQPIENYEYKPLSPREQQKVCTSAGIGVADLMRLWATLKQMPLVRGQPKPTVTATVPGKGGLQSTEAFRLRLRGLHQPATSGEIIERATAREAFEYALSRTDLTAAEPVMEWVGTKQLACLDVDYHYSDPRMIPPEVWREVHAAGTKPTPICYHLSHGGGVKLYYVERDGFAADELAAVAAVQWINLDGRCRVEIKSQSRHPRYPRPSASGEQRAGTPIPLPGSIDVTALAAWFGRVVSDETVAEWLTEHGYKIGDRLEHQHCPIHPGYHSHGTPVYVGDSGIFCHSCESAGRHRGGRRPGYVSYASLAGTIQPTIKAMVDRLAHWEHAKIVLADRLRLPESATRLAYAALLKLVHGADDPRIPLVFAAGRDLVRQERRWTDVSGSVTYPRDIRDMRAALPATQFKVGDNGTTKLKSDPEKVNRFQQQCSLLPDGYPPVTPLPGCKIYGHFLDYPDERILYPVPHAAFRVADGRYAPRYLPRDKRHPEPWSVVEKAFPGVNRSYVRLLIIQKGFIEGQQAQAPYIVTDGVTKAGKSTTIHLAASICGDYCTDVLWVADTVRLRQAIYAANDAGTFVAVNEVFKEAERAKVNPVQAVDPVLNLTEGSTSHVLYTGPVALSRLPALVCTDIRVADSVFADKQLSRRFVHVNLRGELDWTKSFLKVGLHRPQLFRLLGDEQAAACNTILSEVIDEFFTSPMLWVDAAKACGFPLLADSEAFESADAELLRLFELVCEAPPLDGSHAQRMAGPGWVVIQQEATSPLAETWGGLCVPGRWTDSRRCKEVDWQKLLRAPREVECDISRYKDGAVYVRFRSGGKKNPDKVNRNCLDA